jgi:phosphatidylglycerophosphate synthase
MSLVRIPLGAALFLAPDDRVFFAIILALSGISDAADGWLARRRAKARGEGRADSGGIGAWLDPLCDKLFAVLAVVAAVIAYAPPLWFLPVMLLRDIVLALLFVPFRLRYRERTKGFDYRAARSGKNTTVLQYAALLALIFWTPAAVPLAIASGVQGVFAVVVIARRGLAHVAGTTS